MSLPKRIHFTWKTEDVPGDMGRYLRLWRELHPGWEITLWTDATMRAFVAAEYPDFLVAYDGYLHPIQRADSFRYLVLNRLGGVYSDLDVEPFRSIDNLVRGLSAFAGVEPDEHMGPDRFHSGAPFLVSNAFLGGEACHPWLRQLVELLPRIAAVPEVFFSTGPSVTTAAALRLKRADRPALVLPRQWSPEIDNGAPAQSDAHLRRLLAPAFDFVEAEGRFVAHRWMTSWVPWHKRHKGLAAPFHAFNRAKWALRRAWYRHLARVDLRDPLFPYFDQFPKPPAEWPTVAVCVVSENGEALPAALASALADLDYPAERLSRVVSRAADTAAPRRIGSGEAPGAAHGRQMRWAALANEGAARVEAERADWVLFVDAGVAGIPADALKAMLSADKPVVALAARDTAGRESDLSVFRYRWGGGIRVVYKIRGADGLAEPERGQRDFLSGLGAFAQIPLDGAGQSFVLVRRDVLDAGVRFGETAYHLHLGGEALALMARHEGFEVAGLTERWVTT